MYYKTITLNLEKMEMNMEMKLTEHFTLEEMCRSETARRQGLPNVPQECHVRKLQNLCRQVLEPTRHHFGVPLRVTSGYRCEAVNRMVGGVPNSQHRQGEAADFVPLKPDGPTLREIWEWMRVNVQYDQLILEHVKGKRWIHVSCRLDLTKNRRQAFEINK